MFNPVKKILGDRYSKDKRKSIEEKEFMEELLNISEEEKKCPICGRQMILKGTFYQCPYNRYKKSCAYIK